MTTAEFLSAAGIGAGEHGMGFVGDGHWKGAHFWWSDRRNAWVVVDHEVQTAHEYEDLALVSLEEGADADLGMNQAALASDFETPRGLWLLDLDDLPAVMEHYGEELTVLTVTDKERLDDLVTPSAESA